MSYSVHLYRAEVRDLAATTPDFAERDNLLPAFTAAHRTYLQDRLRRYGYLPTGNVSGHQGFESPVEPSVSALITNKMLYFSASSDGIFEAGMTAS